jgi:hypothetical protein
VKRLAVLAGVAALVTACSGSNGKMLGGPGVSLRLPHGWYGVSGPGQLQAADFPLAHGVLASAQRARVRRGHVHLIVWDYGPSVPYLAESHPSLRGPLVVRWMTGPFEGFPDGHAFAGRSATVDGEVLQVLVDLGPKPVAATRLRDVNRVLRTLRVASPRIVQPHDGVLRSDGISLGLPAGWRGRIEIPRSRFATRLVLRARKGETRLTLLELPRSFRGQELPLPVRLKAVNAHLARRVFATSGRSFDVSAVSSSPAGLEQANRLISGLRLVRLSGSCGLRLAEALRHRL